MSQSATKLHRPEKIDGDSKVLIVDDFELVRMTLRKTLEGLGFKNIDEATDGAQALEKLNKAADQGRPYDIVFLDWNMPHVTGIEVVEDCRKDKRHKLLPIIMVTAELERQHIVAALSAGANDYVVKPFTAEIIKNKIHFLNKRLQIK